jgi:fructose-bisphosphate aldolase, class I
LSRKFVKKLIADEQNQKQLWTQFITSSVFVQVQASIFRIFYIVHIVHHFYIRGKFSILGAACMSLHKKVRAACTACLLRPRFVSRHDGFYVVRLGIAIITIIVIISPIFSRFFEGTFIMALIDSISQALGSNAASLLNHECKTIPKSALTLPAGDIIDTVYAHSDRNNRVLNNIGWLLNTGRLAGTGYTSILPVDQGIEHSAGASFAKNPAYFDPENIVKLAIEGGCNGVASTYGVLGLTARKYAHKIPYIVKINHNELLTYPNKADQIMYGTIKQCYEMGAAAVGATIYFGSADSGRQIVEVAQAFAHAHEFGMATILWCYVRNNAFKSDKDYHVSADLTGQANHLGVTIEADIIKQKLPENNGGYKSLNMGNSSYGKLDERMYSELASDHPIDLCRYQVANCYMGKIGLINSGGASGANDFAEATQTAVVNKRAGGMGLISGRKAFQRPMAEGAKLLQTIQDVYLCKEVTIA